MSPRSQDLKSSYKTLEISREEDPHSNLRSDTKTNINNILFLLNFMVLLFSSYKEIIIIEV
jgi:hypothetical protein